MPTAARMDNEEKSLILDMYFKKRMTLTDIAKAVGRKQRTVSKYIHSMTDTTQIAQHMIRARAAELTTRILDKADVDQAMDILSRPNIGVLAPLNKTADGPQIHISVNTESIGAVAIGLPTPQLPSSSPSDTLAIVGGTHERPRLLSGNLEDGDREQESGRPEHEIGPELSTEAGAGFRGTPIESSAPSGPTRVERDSRNARSGRQGRVGAPSPEVVEVLATAREKVKKDRPRRAITNKARPRSSINLRYDIETGDD